MVQDELLRLVQVGGEHLAELLGTALEQRLRDLRPNGGQDGLVQDERLGCVARRGVVNLYDFA